MENLTISQVKKWSLWCYNYKENFEFVINRVWMDDEWLAKHLAEKWEKIKSLNTREGAMIVFFLEIDSTCQRKLLDYVSSN